MSDELRLIEALAESQRFGALGESPEVAIAHSERFLAALGAASAVLDLGSGGGVPGLVLAVRLPQATFALLDRRSARTDLLSRLVSRLGFSDRVQVLAGDALILGRDKRYAGTFDAVVARSFGTPGMTARCAAPFLRLGGHLIVSEPPEDHARWDTPEVTSRGFQPVEAPPGLKVLRFEP